MIGIEKIGVYIPEDRESNLEKLVKFGLDDEFLENKIGFSHVAKKNENIKASDLCVNAFSNLLKQIPLDINTIDCLCVCTQNGDYQLPQTSAIVQSKLNLPETVACFDISLGCSGYVYSLDIFKSFMTSNGFQKGLLFTADPYSEILDPQDKNTNLLFGDAATVTLLSTNPVYISGRSSYLTDGSLHKALIKEKNKSIHMNGRTVFNFCLSKIPLLIETCITENNLTKADIDQFLLHQASKYMVDRIVENLQISSEKAPFIVNNYGNTVSSTIPIMLKDIVAKNMLEKIIIAGFGVGLSAAATVLIQV